METFIMSTSYPKVLMIKKNSQIIDIYANTFIVEQPSLSAELAKETYDLVAESFRSSDSKKGQAAIS